MKELVQKLRGAISIIRRHYRHSRESGNPEKHWIPGQARNDKVFLLIHIPVIVLGFVIVFTVHDKALAGSKTFPAGSYIIPLEPCWQPNNDPEVSPVPAGCDTDRNDQGIFHAYGMVLDLLSNGVPAYWIINPDKAGGEAVDFSIAKGGADAAVRIIHSKALTSTGSLAQVDYRGGPFVIDANDLTPEIRATAENIMRNTYLSAKVHIAGYDFSAPVDKVLSGTPPRVAVLGEGATQVLLDYLKASGLGNRVFAIFRSVTSQDIINGVLSNFQLLWAPHWIVESESKVQADRDKILSAMRSFLEKGNAGFFECASIESLEGSIELGEKTQKTTGLDSQASGGFLTDKTYKVPRIDSNNGSMNSADMVFEDPAFYLDQCSGWKFVPQSGHIHNFRPRKDTSTAGHPLQPASPYTYNSTVSRFIHDRDNSAYSAGIPASPPGYDHFVGGRINGIRTQGYVAYLAGHRYIQCSNTELPVPSDRTFDLSFDRDISIVEHAVVTIEAVYSGCTQGVNCPKLSYDISNPVEDIAHDGTIYVQSERALYDPTTKKLSSIVIGNLTTTTTNITKILVTFPAGLLPPDPDKQAFLIEVADVTDPKAPAQLCTPNTASVSTCTPASTLALGSLATSCAIDWARSNTCGIRYVLNTLLGLQLQIVPNEYNKASPIVKDNVLYKGTFEYPGYKGHLYALDVLSNAVLWDAGKHSTMPAAGANNPAAPARSNSARYIFTNIPGTGAMVNFEDSKAGILGPYLDPSDTRSLNWARALINSVRGRSDATEMNPLGTRDIRKRLGGIEHSTPAVLKRSSVIRDNTGTVMDRDKIVFAGGDDGMLHAFHAGSWDQNMNSGSGGYSQGTGKEIWAYIPSSLLSSLRKQTFTDCNPGDHVQGCTPNADANNCVCPAFPVAVAVDGSPAIGDFFVDHDNDPNTPHVWKTVLVGTAVILSPGQNLQSANQGVVFALDVTNPYIPKLLWERTYGNKVDPAVQKIGRNYYPMAADHNGGYFPASYMNAESSVFDINMGNSRGAAVGRVQVGTKLNTFIFLTSKWVNRVNTGSADLPHDVWGLSAYALDFRTGDLVWETKNPPHRRLRWCQ